jgi:hypothetical protein
MKTKEYYKGYVDGHVAGLLDAEATYDAGWLAGFAFSEATFECKAVIDTLKIQGNDNPSVDEVINLRTRLKYKEADSMIEFENNELKEKE